MRAFGLKIGSRSFSRPARSVERWRIVDINLLPVGRRPVDIAPAGVGVVLVLVLCIVAMVPLAFEVQAARSSASSMEQQADDAEVRVQALQLSLARQRGLAEELAAAKAQLATIESRRESFQGGSRPIEEDITMLFGYGAFLPPGVRLTSITGADHALTVAGTAPGPLEAIAYAERLVTAGGFPSAHLVSYAPGAKDAGQFSIEVAR